MSMCDYCVTTRNEDGAYFYVYADRYEINGKGSCAVLHFFRNDDIVSAIPMFMVFRLERFEFEDVIVEFQIK